MKDIKKEGNKSREMKVIPQIKRNSFKPAKDLS